MKKIFILIVIVHEMACVTISIRVSRDVLVDSWIVYGSVEGIYSMISMSRLHRWKIGRAVDLERLIKVVCLPHGF